MVTQQVLELLCIGLLTGLLLGTLLGVWVGSLIARGHYLHLAKHRMMQQATARQNGYAREVPRRAAMYEDYAQ